MLSFLQRLYLNQLNRMDHKSQELVQEFLLRMYLQLRYIDCFILMNNIYLVLVCEGYTSARSSY